MRNSILFFCLTLFIALIIGCKEQPREIKKNKTDKAKENLITVNKYLVEQDADKIKGFISRRNWKMKTTATGLYYWIYEHGKGEGVQTGDTVKLNFKISLLDGTLCYSSEQEGPKTFVVGKGGVEAGLEEGTLLLHEGDKAYFILMPHLAHGLIGDGKLIPARSTIVYEIELIQIIQ